MANRIGTAQHGVFELWNQRDEGRVQQETPQTRREEIRVLVPSEQGHALRIIDVLVEDTFKIRLGQSLRQRLGVCTSAKGKQLHEKPLVENHTLTVTNCALLSDVDLFHAYFPEMRIISETNPVRIE